MKNFKNTSGLRVLEDGSFHSAIYTWKDGSNANIILNNGKLRFRIKGGISRLFNHQELFKEMKRSDVYERVPVQWTDNFIDQNLSEAQARKIITLMDGIAKKAFDDMKISCRSIYSDWNGGTEVYEHESEEELNSIIHNTFMLAYKVAYERTTRKSVYFPPVKNPFTPRIGQDTLVINPSFEHFINDDLGYIRVHGGGGKSKMFYRISERVCHEIYKSSWKVLGFADTQQNTIQLASGFAEFYTGQTGKRLSKIYIVGSLDDTKQKDINLMRSWAQVIEVHNARKIKRMLSDCNKNTDCAIFVVNKSAASFLSIANNYAVDFKNFVTGLDEIQQYAKEQGTAKLITDSSVAVIQPQFAHLFGKKLGMTATPICRGTEIRSDVVFNDDVQYFGPRLANIDANKARELGWICDKEGLIITIGSNPELVTAVQENRSINYTLDDLTISMMPAYYAGIVALTENIIPLGKKKIIVLTAFNYQVDSYVKLITKMQELGMIPSDFNIIGGKSKSGVADVREFENSDKAIIFSTRWIGVGQDTASCDCVLPLYNPKMEWYRQQLSMRGDRWYDGKIGMLAYIAMEDNFQDSPWWNILEESSNGEVPNIVSQAQFRELVQEDPNNLDLGSNRNAAEGEHATNGNITAIVADRDPITSATWRDFINAIGTRRYTVDGQSTAAAIWGLKGKWDIKENVLAEALKCEGRGEFWRENQPAYFGAVRNGWLDEIFPDKSWTTEKVWNLLKNGNFKNITDFVTTYNCSDALNRLGIKDEVKAFFGADNRSIEELFVEAKKYNTKTEFNNADNKAYQRLYTNKLLDEACIHMEEGSKGRPKGTKGGGRKKGSKVGEYKAKFTKEECFEAAKQVSSPGEFKEKFKQQYNTAKYKGWYKECKTYFKKK